MMTISLVIPAYNEEDYIGACLDSALKNSHGKFKEIIVVDNASTDRTADIARQRPGVVVIREDRKGTGHARQTGLEHATGEFIAFMDADTRLPERWFGMVETVFLKNPQVVLLSGPYRYYDSTWHKRWTQYFLWWISAPLMYRLVGYMALGGNIVVRRDALLRAGGISRDITFYGDDTDLARKMHTVGTVVWRMDFFVYASMRRFSDGGMFKMNVIYALNFIWPVIFHRPFSVEHHDTSEVRTNATVKSWFATSVFGLAGIVAVLFYSIVSPFLLPHFIIYTVLVFNTFFSIRFWSALQPKDMRQLLVDAVLVVTYLTLAFSIGQPFYFALAALLLFTVAPLKYILMRGRTPHAELVEKKILIDSLGTLACIGLVIGLFLGGALDVTWLFAIAFTLANIYLLFIRPMYRL